MSIDYTENLRYLKNTGSIRTLRPLSARQGCRINYQGKQYLNLTSNDYLGLAGDVELLTRFYSIRIDENLLDMYGLGAASSRLLTGDIETAHQLEEDLKREYERPAALLFNSGYHANIGILPTLLGKGDLILSDKLNHASIHDGMQLCRAVHKRYRHCDYDHLQDLLEKNRTKYGRVVIASESVFSMDGDVADLRQLVSLKKQYDSLLYVDEAHAVGLYGDKGLGKAEEQGVMHDVDLLVGTFGKAYASVGAFVLCDNDIHDYLINHSRSLIFTTALPPVVLHWNLRIFNEVLKMQKKRRHLLELAEKLRQSLACEGSCNRRGNQYRAGYDRRQSSLCGPGIEDAAGRLSDFSGSASDRSCWNCKVSPVPDRRYVLERPRSVGRMYRKRDARKESRR